MRGSSRYRRFPPQEMPGKRVEASNKLSDSIQAMKSTCVELFDLYVDFPEFFDRSLDRAADLIGSAASEESRAEMSMRLRMSGHNHSGLEGPIRSVTLWTVSGLGYVAPLP